MDTKALRQFSYGVYLVTACDETGKAVGCVVNTGVQLTSKPYRVMAAVNHDNATYAAVKRTRRFAVCCLNEAADMNLIGTFGFKSSSEVDKFAGFETSETAHGVPFVRTGVGAVVECELVTALDVGTHELFIGEVTDAQVLDADTPPMTYNYYHTVLKGTTPPKASAFIGDVGAAVATIAGETKPESHYERKPAPVVEPEPEAPAAGDELHHFECQLCGYVYETTDEELPDDFVCPMCGAGKGMFLKLN